jgi:Cysteine-rich secretory protein family
MASLQLKTCASHDPCHNTCNLKIIYLTSSLNFSFISDFNDSTGQPVISGQNIAFMFTTGDRDPILQNFQDGIQKWMDESQLTAYDVVSSVQTSSAYTTGHFIQMVHDKNTRVGCAMVQWTQVDETFGDVMKCSSFTCNYFKSPYKNQPLYDIGNLCSKCKVCDQEDMVGLCIE